MPDPGSPDPEASDLSRRNAASHADWRGGETVLNPEAGAGHTLPASEDDGRLHDQGRAPASPPEIMPPD